MLLVDHEVNKLAAYATWGHVTATTSASSGLHIEVGWFGVDSAYQGRADASGRSVAGGFNATLEARARASSRSTPEMPLTLVCHMDNESGLGFWGSRGYRVVNENELEDDVYYRLVR